MDINKIIKYALYGAVAILGMLIINAWERDYPPVANNTTPATGVSSADDYVPQPLAASSSVPNAPVAASSERPSPVTPHMGTHISNTGFIRVTTDLYQLEIDPVGGNIVSAYLLKYPVSTEEKNKPIQILNPNQNNLYIMQAGIVNGGSQKVVYHATANRYDLTGNQKELTITLNGQTDKGLRLQKTYTFKRGAYAIDVDVKVTNQTATTWQNGGFFYDIIRKNVPAEHPYLQRRSYDGAAISSVSIPYKQYPFKTLAETNLNQTANGGWIAMQQPYFLTSWVPNKNSVNDFYSRSHGNGKHGDNNIFTLGYVSTAVNLAPGQTASNSSTLYLGPELAEQLRAVDPTLERTIDYGWLAPISMLIFTVMKWIFSVIGNWGWTIVLVTFLIKLIFYPLSNKSYISMAKMREAQPRLKALQSRFADDKQALNKALMEFYKREKLNPMGGCLPMLIQIPVFFALYYVLIESVQLRQAPFMLWVHDLAVRDPYFILPILMGASMLLQQRLSPPPPDPTQAKMMMLMPVVFTVMFLWFPSGLVLYWITNNCLSILHQWYVIKTFDPKKQNYKDREKTKRLSAKR